MHSPLGEFVYKENTSDKWHVPRYPTRKHCITTLSHAYIFGKLTEILRRARKYLWEFLKTSEMLQTCFWKLNCLKKIFLNVWQSSEVFGKIRRRSKMVLKCSENLRKSSEVFGNSRKTSETAQECFSNDLWLF